MKFPEQFRWSDPPDPRYRTKTGDAFGGFIVPADSAFGRELKIIASDGRDTGWDHVSVSLPAWPKKQPNWAEMCLVKDLFWDETECVIQFHPPKADHINHHPGVLHLWRWTKGEFPMPPKICV